MKSEYLWGKQNLFMLLQLRREWLSLPSPWHLKQKSWESHVTWFWRQNPFLESGRDPYQYWMLWELQTEWYKRWVEATDIASFDRNQPSWLPGIWQCCHSGEHVAGSKTQPLFFLRSGCSVNSWETVACRVFWFPLFLSSLCQERRSSWADADCRLSACQDLSWLMCYILCPQCAAGPQRDVCLSNHGGGAVWQECRSGRRPGSPPGALHPPGGRPQQHDALRRPHCVQAPHLPGAALLRVPPSRDEGVHPWVQRSVTGQCGESSSVEALSPVSLFCRPRDMIEGLCGLLAVKSLW